MSTGYDPNIEGAITVLVDLMSGNGFTLTRKPYAPNYRGLVDCIIDLKDGLYAYVPHRVGFNAVVFENVNKNDAVYLRVADGQAGKASASGVSFDAACVIGFAEEAVLSGGTARIIVAGFQTFTTTLDPGDLYFLSAATAGQITTTPPSTAGQYVTRVGEASTTSEFVIQIEPPIRLR